MHACVYVDLYVYVSADAFRGRSCWVPCSCSCRLVVSQLADVSNENPTGDPLGGQPVP